MVKSCHLSILLFFFAVLVTACGGGGSGSEYSTSVDGEETSYQIGGMFDGVFQPGRLALSIGENQAIAPGGTLTVSAAVVYNEEISYTFPIEINFSSVFSESGKAEIESPKTTVNGEAVAVYNAKGEDGIDTITATTTIEGQTLTAQATLVVGDRAAMHLEFVYASHGFIALKNTGGPARSETSVLTFKVVDINGAPVSGQTVDFQLSTEVGGLFLSTESDVSDASGLIHTTVNAGTVSTEVKVHATLKDSDPLVTVVSDTLIISTGLPDQNSISIGPEVFNPEAGNYNNVEVPIIFQAADHFNNFVPDGTVVYFTTELGSIDDSCTFPDDIQKGACTVLWRSGNPRDSYCDDLTPACTKGMSTITAFLIGEESFTDFNGNGYFDPEDAFDTDTDMGEPFRDDNDNGIRDSFEPWWDFNANGWYDGTPNGIYNGSLCSDEAEGLGLCTDELVYAQISTQIVMSGSFANTFTLSAGQGLITVTIADINGNPMPEGSTIEIVGTTENTKDESITIPSTLTGTVYSIRVSEPGAYYGKVTTPFKNVSYSSNTVTIN